MAGLTGVVLDRSNWGGTEVVLCRTNWGDTELVPGRSNWGGTEVAGLTGVVLRWYLYGLTWWYLGGTWTVKLMWYWDGTWPGWLRWYVTGPTICSCTHEVALVERVLADCGLARVHKDGSGYHYSLQVWTWRYPGRYPGNVYRVSGWEFPNPFRVLQWL